MPRKQIQEGKRSSAWKRDGWKSKWVGYNFSFECRNAMNTIKHITCFNELKDGLSTLMPHRHSAVEIRERWWTIGQILEQHSKTLGFLLEEFLTCDFFSNLSHSVDDFMHINQYAFMQDEMNHRFIKAEKDLKDHLVQPPPTTNIAH